MQPLCTKLCYTLLINVAPGDPNSCYQFLDFLPCQSQLYQQLLGPVPDYRLHLGQICQHGLGFHFHADDTQLTLRLPMPPLVTVAVSVKLLELAWS